MHNITSFILFVAMTINILAAEPIDKANKGLFTGINANPRLMKLFTLKASSLDNDENMVSFFNQFKSMSEIDKKQINSLMLDSSISKKNIKNFFETIGPIKNQILNVNFLSSEIGWDFIGKNIGSLENIVRFDFDLSSVSADNLSLFFDGYQYALKLKPSNLRCLSLSNCLKLNHQDTEPLITSLVTNTKKYPNLAVINLQQRQGNFLDWNNTYIQINRAIDIGHSYRLQNFMDEKTGNVQGNSTLYRGAFIFTHVNSDKTFNSSVELDHYYGDWFDGIPFNYEIPSTN